MSEPSAPPTPPDEATMRAVARMAGGLAHEFNNLLMVLGGNLDFLRGRLTDAGVPLDEVTEMGHALAEARALAGDLAAIGRRRRRGTRRVDLAPALAAAAPTLRTGLAPDCTLDVAPVAPGLAALVDPAALDEALAALAAGAREGVRTLRRMAEPTPPAAPAAATLTAAGRTLAADDAAALGLAPGTWVAIALRAPGPGVPSDAPHAFEPFHTPDGRGKGALLRLAVVWALARHEGGAATADYPAPGERTLTLWLPLAPAVGDALDPEGDGTPAPGPPDRGRPGDDPPPASAPSILVVDDDAGVRGTIRRVLERGGHVVLDASDGEAALTLLARVGVAARGGAVGLVLTDVRMPGLSAGALLATLRERWPTLPVLCMTGLADGEDGAVPRDAGVPVLDKPIEAGTLLAHVRTALLRSG